MKFRRLIISVVTSLAIVFTGLGITIATSPAADAATPCTSQLFVYDLSSKTCVKYIQTLVNDISKRHTYLGNKTPLKVDGKYGTLTQTAVLNLQNHAWLVPKNGDKVTAIKRDGKTGEQTWLFICVYGESTLSAWKAAGCQPYLTSHLKDAAFDVLAKSQPAPRTPAPTSTQQVSVDVGGGIVIKDECFGPVCAIILGRTSTKVYDKKLQATADLAGLSLSLINLAGDVPTPLSKAFTVLGTSLSMWYDTARATASSAAAQGACLAITYVSLGGISSIPLLMAVDNSANCGTW